RHCGWPGRRDRYPVRVTVTERISTELRDAMRSGRADRRDALRLIYAALQKAEKDRPEGFGDDQALAVLRSERKRRIEAADAYQAAGQQQRADAERAEMAVIEEFLPAAMSDAELESLVDGVIAETGATTMKDMGRVMGL